jgi:hypothetical protein
VPKRAEPRQFRRCTVGAERERLAQCTPHDLAWKKWGPYLSERQWGTVREDYSATATCGATFRTITRAAASIAGAKTARRLQRSRAALCLSLALWNGAIRFSRSGCSADERRRQSRRGREGALLLPRRDADHSYLKMLYKYPQRAYPYAAVGGEPAPLAHAAEYELLDTGAFADNRYFDVFVEYAQANVDDVLMRVTVHNRGAERAALHILPQLFFRNTWAWRNGAARPRMRCRMRTSSASRSAGDYHWYVDNGPLCFSPTTETNAHRSTTFPTPATSKTHFTSA